MSAPKDGGPAFPVADSHHANGQVQYGHNGMTLRDWFAGQHINGVSGSEWAGEMHPEYLAELSYVVADAMLAERENSK